MSSRRTLGKSTFLLVEITLAALLLVACGDNVPDDPPNQAPVVSNPTNRIQVAENTAGPIYTVPASDPAHQALTFSLVATDKKDEAFFVLGETNGALEFKTPPDFERPFDGEDNRYSITIRVTEKQNLSTSFDLDIEVTNDVTETQPAGNTAPRITNLPQPVTFSIVENTTAVTTFVATDDEQTFLSLTLTGTDASLFSVNEVSGELTFNTAPDYENPADADKNRSYGLAILVNDGWLGIEVNFTVSVINSNEAPSFITTSINVPENTTVITTPVAKDPDNDPLVFSMLRGAVDGVDASPDADAFDLNASTGVLSFKTAPNFEKPTDANQDRAYVVKISASDGSYTRTEILTINIDDSNDPPVMTTTPALSSPENTRLVSTLQASDEDKDAPPLTYAIKGGLDAALFELASHGELYFKTAPNFEHPTDNNGDNIYEVMVAAYDGTINSGVLTLLVQVTNGNDPPVLTSANDFTAFENTTTIAQLTATDPDGNSTLSYSIVAGASADADLLTITSNGQLSFSAAPDFEVPNDFGADHVYDVVITVTDGVASNTATISITVQNVAELDPSFGVNGVFTHHNAAGGNRSDSGNSIAITPEGKFLVVGSSDGPNIDGYGGPYADLAVWRLNADGTLDTDPITGFGPAPTAGTNRPGFITHHNAAGGDYSDSGAAVALTPEGKIVVVGYSQGRKYIGTINVGSTYADMAVWRLNADGSLDSDLATGFGPVSTDGTKRQGYFTHHNAAGGVSNDYGWDVTLTPSGKIVVVGESWGPAINGLSSQFDLVVWRLDKNGGLDTDRTSGFGPVSTDGTKRQGYLTHNNAAGGYGNGSDSGNAVALTPDGKIVVVGHSETSTINGVSTGYDLAVWRINVDGSLDTSFGFGPSANPSATAVGYMTHNTATGGNGNDAGTAVVLAPGGKILVVGRSEASALQGVTINYDMAVWRLNVNGTLDTSFGYGPSANPSITPVGYMTHHNAAGGNGSDAGYAVALAPEGKIVVVGDSYGPIINGIDTQADLAVWYLNANGTPDTNFGPTQQGYLTHHNAAGGNGYDFGGSVALTTNSSSQLDKIVVVGGSYGLSTETDLVVWRIQN